MPLSGSYFYPQVQAPNSSYPNVALRNVTIIPTGSNSMMKIFVSGSANALFGVLPNGTVVRIITGSV